MNQTIKITVYSESYTVTAVFSFTATIDKSVYLKT